VHAWRLPMDSPVRIRLCQLLCGGRGPHARAVRGRDISRTKVKALPESLGQCKLLETLCVRAAALRVLGGAGAALLRVRCRAGRWAAPRGVGCGGGGVAGRRPRPTGARQGWAGAARRGRTVGAQARVEHRDRSAAGGGRLAQADCTVSAPAAALTRPRRCADAWRAASGARTRRCTTRYMCACICVYVAVHAHVCIRMRACAECLPAWACACARWRWR
jgi:hypothetical protein